MNITANLETTPIIKYKSREIEEKSLDILLAFQKELAWDKRQKEINLPLIEITAKFDRDDVTDKFLTLQPIEEKSEDIKKQERFIPGSDEYYTIQLKAIYRFRCQEELLSLIEDYTHKKLGHNLKDDYSNKQIIQEIVGKGLLDEMINDELEHMHDYHGIDDNDIAYAWIESGRAGEFNPQYIAAQPKLEKICKNRCKRGCKKIENCSMPSLLIQESFETDDPYCNIDYAKVPEHKVVNE